LHRPVAKYMSQTRSLGPLLVLYASQTGNAKEIASLFSDELEEELCKLGHSCLCQGLDDFLKASTSVSIFVSYFQLLGPSLQPMCMGSL